MTLRRFFVGRAVGFLVLVVLAGLVALFYSATNGTKNSTVGYMASDYKNAEYLIDGKYIRLTNGIATQDAAPGSAAKIVTRYFGNELRTDLDGDGREDIVFLLTQQDGGSGTFFYVVAALNTPDGYVGSDGYLLGDRIAPQTTELSKNPVQKHVVVVNFATRAEGEPMTARPSVGRSVYLKLDPEAMQWGIVEPNFEGESR